MSIFLVIIFSAAFAVLASRNLVNALAAAVLLLPTYLLRFSIGPLPMTLLEVMILIIAAVFVLKNARQFRIKFSNYKWLILALLFFSGLAVWAAPDRLAALGIWKAYFAEPILFFIVLINVVNRPRDREKIVYALGLSALAVAGFAIYQKFTGAFIYNEFWQAEASRRVTGFYGYPNAVGLYLAPITVLFAGKMYLDFISARLKSTVKAVGPKLIFNSAVVITGIAVMVFARSEGALAATFAGFIFLGLLMKKLRTAALAVLLVGAVLVMALPGVNQLVGSKASFADDSGSLRVIIWQETIQMLKTRPLFGAGLAGYQTAIRPYHHAQRVFEIYLYPHHIILNFWSEIGLLGLLTMLFLIIKFFTNYLKVKNFDNRQWYLVLMCVMIAILVHGLVDVPYFKNDLAVLWWLVIGLGDRILNLESRF